MVDYSSWKKIELSSDEDEVHPFIENATLFRLKHEARLKKMEERKNEEFAYECRKARNFDQLLNSANSKALDSWTKRLQNVELAIADRKKVGAEVTDLQLQLAELEVEKEELKTQEEKLKTQEVAWYIDTICQPGFSKTLINTSILEVNECFEEFNDFVEKNKSYLKHFALLNSFEEMKNFLIMHREIIRRQTLYFLISYGIKLYLRKEKPKLKIVCRQIVFLLHILELFKMSGKKSEELLLSFFVSVNLADEHCLSDFEAESVKVKKLIKTFVLDELNDDDVNDETNIVGKVELPECDPENIFRSLPKEMQHCFLQRNKAKLVEILAQMPVEEARYHMKRCIDSGLWVCEKNE